MLKIIKIKDNVNLKELEKFEFVRDVHFIDSDGNTMYSYEFLTINIKTRELCICTGVDELCGNKEIIKLYDLIQAGLVEKVVEDE